MESHTYSNTPCFSLNNHNCLARLVNVHDGDTITVIIEYPISVFSKYNVRLDSVDTSEITSHDPIEKDKAITSRNLLLRLATNGDIDLDNKKRITRNDIINLLDKKVYLVFLKCKNMDKYGRVLANVYTYENMDVSLNKILLDTNLAYEYHGGTKQNLSNKLKNLNL